ncbi:GNAT family N-acetyltransferase [Paenibacillus thiaminolyticus]|uniref:GNAT family N-acetyltransferase n=1 Tax=Paenibacillus thiaminolyticus TaxID=49283 RepID=UPI0035A6458E
MKEMDQRISAYIQHNFMEKVSFVARESEGMSVQTTDQYMRVDCGMPADTFNIGVLRADDAGSEGAVRQMTDYFAARSFPMSLWCWEPLGASTLQEIEHAGLSLAEVNEGMYAYAEDLSPGAYMPEGFAVKQVRTPGEVAQFGAVLSCLFGESSEAKHVSLYYDRLAESQLWTRPEMALYIGVLNDGTPVTVGSTIRSRDNVGIYDIATLDEYRKRGFGSAMFHHILSDILTWHDGLIVLQASEAGAGLYKRAGFRPVCAIRVFENGHGIE